VKKNTPYSLRCGGVFVLAFLPGATILRAAILEEIEYHRSNIPQNTGHGILAEQENRTIRRAAIFFNAG
jgi:hypothetical protein